MTNPRRNGGSVGLEQYFTPSDVVEQTLQLIPELDFTHYYECSAGDGAFLQALNKPYEATDLEPQHPTITQQDAFDWQPQPDRRYVVLGNPPFGRSASIARRLFNHITGFEQVLAVVWVVPRTFRRPTVAGALNSDFGRVADENVRDDCWVNNGAPIKCCVQLWQRGAGQRISAPPKTHKDFTWATRSTAEFAIIARGGRAGQVLSPEHFGDIRHDGNIHFISGVEPFAVEPPDSSVGQPVITQGDVVAAYSEHGASQR